MTIDQEVSSWLPELVLFEQYKGNWDLYINAVYQFFLNDFVHNRAFFLNLPVFVRYHPSFNLKGATFWHLVSEGKIESERTPDFRRCERIRWPRAIIDHVISGDIKIWETIRPWKKQKQKRINFALANFSYIVVIAQREKGYDLVTAYLIEQSHRREKLKKEFETFSRQKKEGTAV